MCSSLGSYLYQCNVGACAGCGPSDSNWASAVFTFVGYVHLPVYNNGTRSWLHWCICAQARTLACPVQEVQQRAITGTHNFVYYTRNEALRVDKAVIRSRGVGDRLDSSAGAPVTVFYC